MGHFFFRSAGARFTVIRAPPGKANPEFLIALRTRSRLSCIAVSPRPTTVNCPIPRTTSTSTSMRFPCIPYMDAERSFCIGSKERRKNVQKIIHVSPDRASFSHISFSHHFSAFCKVKIYSNIWRWNAFLLVCLSEKIETPIQKYEFEQILEIYSRNKYPNVVLFGIFCSEYSSCYQCRKIPVRNVLRCMDYDD